MSNHIVAYAYTADDEWRLEQLWAKACGLLLHHTPQLTNLGRPMPLFWRNWANELVKIAREIELIFGATPDGPDTP